jgi:peptidylprolyl isomerase
LQLKTPEGALPVRVTEVKEEGVVIDGNHPLAGKDLTFDLTLVEAA